MEHLQLSNFLLAGVSSLAVTVITNPLDVIKTQMQSQANASKSNVDRFKMIRTARHILRKDGLIGLQRGLFSALAFQFTLNSIRFGIFDTAIALGINRPTSIRETFFWGGFSGIVGTIFAHPFHVVKTQMQTNTNRDANMLRALFLLYGENGLRSMYRGVYTSIPRAAMASGAQLASFMPSLVFIQIHEARIMKMAIEAGFDPKSVLFQPDRWQERRLIASLLCGGLAGLTMALTLTPADTVLTRLASQPVDEHGRGLLYRGSVDCMMQMLRAEGLAGMYRGFWPNQMRVALHTTLLLVSYDQLKVTRDG